MINITPERDYIGYYQIINITDIRRRGISHMGYVRRVEIPIGRYRFGNSDWYTDIPHEGIVQNSYQHLSGHHREDVTKVTYVDTIDTIVFLLSRRDRRS